MANTVNVPNPAGQTTTKLENAESGFKASETLAANLQKVLVDFIALELVGKHAHWNIVGPNFRDLHLNLDEVVEIAREGADEIAEPRWSLLQGNGINQPGPGALPADLKQISFRPVPVPVGTFRVECDGTGCCGESGETLVEMPRGLHHRP